MKFRALRAEEIECRVSTVKESGCSLLLYHDARCAMRILNETVGNMNWQREHYDCKGNLFCRVGINRNYADAEQPAEWIWKSDCGKESRTEAKKGESSDSFKRACVNWGIGLELHTAPLIWVPLADQNGEINYRVNQKGQPMERFRVASIRIEDGKIQALQIENGSGKIVYTYGSRSVPRCVVCGQAVSEKIAAGSVKKYGHVYCSGACMERGKQACAKAIENA